MTLALAGKTPRRRTFLVFAAIIAIFISMAGGASLYEGERARANTAPTDGGTIQVHKYLPKDNVNIPWKNEAKVEFVFKVYDNEALSGNPLFTFNQLGAPQSGVPQTSSIWLTEVAKDGYASNGYWIPDADNTSGNDKCVKPTSAILPWPLEIAPDDWDTKGNQDGLFHVCAYNTPEQDGFIEVYKVVTNVADDPTLFDADIDGGASFTFSELAYSGGHQVDIGPHMVTEAAEAGYDTKGWALGTGGGNPVCPATWTSTAGDNSADILVANNNTTIVCFYNEKQLPGFIEVYKVVTNVTDDPTLFDADIDGGASFTFSELAYSGNHPVAVGAHVVTEAAEPGYNTLGWALWTGNPQAVCPAEPTHSGDNSAEITVASNNTTVICFYNELQYRDINVCKVVLDNGDSTVDGGTFKFDVRYYGAPPPYDKQYDMSVVATEADGVAGVCEKASVPAGVDVEIVEWMGAAGRPGNWNGDEAGYPQYQVGSGATVAGETAALSPTDERVTFFNSTVTRTGTVIVRKIVTGDASNVADQFGGTVSGPTNQTFSDLSATNDKVYDSQTAGDYTVAETNVNGYTLLGYSFGSGGDGVFCPGEPTASTSGSEAQTLSAGGTVVFCIHNRKDAQVITGAVYVQKVVVGTPISASDSFGGTLTGKADWSLANGGIAVYSGIVIPEAGVSFTANETSMPAHYVNLGYSVVPGNDACPASAAGSASTATLTQANTLAKICVYNQAPRGSIEVTKTTVTSHNGATDQPAPQDDDGWKITLVSVACGVNTSGVTDNQGKVLFENLLLCNDYVVAEDLSAPGASDYVPVGASSVSGVTPAIPATQVNFTNRKSTFDPPCIGCVPFIFETPVPPPPTPVPPTPVPPTPVIDVVLGEKTPDVLATPIAPVTGNGGPTSTGGTFNIFFVLLGTAILGGGFALASASRRNNRN